MTWIDIGILIAVVFAVLFILATGMNLLWGDEVERKQAQEILVQLGVGCIIVVSGVLVMIFVVKPVLSMIAQKFWYLFP